MAYITPVSNEPLAPRQILVIGEAILDEYIQGQVTRLSREAPVPIVTNPATTHRCGGAANAAANLAALGSEVTLLAAVGADTAGSTLTACCEQAGITTQFLNQRQTHVKQRILGSGQQLLRVDRMCSDELAAEITRTATSLVGDFDAVLLSDYGTQLLRQSRTIIAAAKKAGVPVCVDPRRADWADYAGASLLKPSLEELNHGATLTDQSVVAYCTKHMTENNIAAVLLTAGSQGMLVLDGENAPIHLPTKAREVFDVTGAGDTVAAVMTLGLANQASLSATAELANKAAGVVVGQLGAVPITPLSLSAPAGGGGEIVELKVLQEKIATHRDQGQHIVMTNGCFDILHAGHLDTLGAAAALGDVLVVAVNDDASVKHLKGEDRPIIPLAQRMQLLANLGCISYVIPFSGTDAADLVTAVAPDIYVKGGDWEGKEPPEAVAAKNAGGRVVYEGFRQEQSTSNIIQIVRDS